MRLQAEWKYLLTQEYDVIDHGIPGKSSVVLAESRSFPPETRPNTTAVAGTSASFWYLIAKIARCPVLYGVTRNSDEVALLYGCGSH